jgi:hypothetical protein
VSEVDIPSGTKPDACRKCSEAVFWVDSEKGRVMMDVEPSTTGRYVLEYANGKPVARFMMDAKAAETYSGERFNSHFHTCRERRKERESARREGRRF